MSTAVGIFSVLFAAILFPLFRSTLLWLLIMTGCWSRLLVIIGSVLLVQFSPGDWRPQVVVRHPMPKLQKTGCDAGYQP